MAKPAATKTAKKPGTAIANVKAIDDALAQKAQALSTQLSQEGMPTIRLDSKKGVFLSGEMDLGAAIRVIIVDFVLAHRFYKGIYNSQDIQPPDCASVGRDPETIAPWENSPDKQNDICKTCPQNQFGTSLRGSGKACKESRDLAVLLVAEDGTVDEKLHRMSVPPTGIKSFDSVARFIGRTYGSTPIKCIVPVEVEDRGEYSTISFGTPEQNPDYAEHFQMLTEAAEMLEREPSFEKRETTKPAAKGKRQPAAKTAPRVPQRGR